MLRLPVLRLPVLQLPVLRARARLPRVFTSSTCSQLFAPGRANGRGIVCVCCVLCVCVCVCVCGCVGEEKERARERERERERERVDGEKGREGERERERKREREMKTRIPSSERRGMVFSEKYAKHGPTMRARVEAREVRTMRSGGWADGGDDGQVEI